MRKIVAGLAISLPVLGPDGLPRHRRGVTEFPGLYFLGMHNQYSRGSSLIHWVRHDAAYLTGQARERASARPAPGPAAPTPATQRVGA